MKAPILLALMFSMVCPAHAEEAYQATAKVWDAMGRKNWDAAIALSLIHISEPTRQAESRMPSSA